MKHSLPSLALAALLALPGIASAAYEAPEQLCHDHAEAAYLQAVAQGDGLPDGMYNRAEAQCLADAYRAHLVASPEVSLNELIAFDHDSEAWLYEGPASDSDRELNRQDAAAFLARCPNAQPGDEACQ